MQRPVVYRARNLRKTMTMPEVALWQYLRQRTSGLKFRRQHPIGPYIVDFCCMSAKVIVEVDGSVHDNAERAASDGARTNYLNEHGYRVLRVSAKRVMADTAGTAAAIVARAENPLHHPAGGPPPRAGED